MATIGDYIGPGYGHLPGECEDADCYAHADLDRCADTHFDLRCHLDIGHPGDHRHGSLRWASND
jgi:hypothetical protein